MRARSPVGHAAVLRDYDVQTGAVGTVARRPSRRSASAALAFAGLSRSPATSGG